jgi:holo-[acyl-carrier protein] synthase
VLDWPSIFFHVHSPIREGTGVILGLGMDLIEVSRFEREVESRGEGLLEEILRPAEIADCRALHRPCRHYAARFAAKEALFKALGTGRSGEMSWLDAEVLKDGSGKPSLRLSGETARLAGRMGVRRVHVSLSHSEQCAGAVVALED